MYMHVRVHVHCISISISTCIHILHVHVHVLISAHLKEMKSLNNFAGMFAVNAAFQSSPVFRLTHTLKV